ncbi:MAG: sugar ABC transporter permease [Firmicutes bacterium]|nr:sugar ABC transporter permease [Bacillota bacterium]
MGSNQNTDKKKKFQKRKQLLSAWVLLFPAVVVLYLMIWRPSIMGIVWSFFKMKGYTPVKFVGFENYIRVVKDTQFWPVLWNTVQYVFWSFVIGFIPPVIIAFMLNEMMHFRNTLRTIIYLPAILPGITILLLWYFIYYPSQTGMLNMLLMKFGFEPYIWLNDARFTILFIVVEMTWAGFPGTMFLYYTTIQGIDTTLYEAATIDGAGLWRRFYHVAIPQISGLLVLNIVRQLIAVFQVMQEPMVMTGGGPNGASTSLGYQLYQYGFVQGRVGQALALGTIVFLILILATCFYFYLNKKVEDNQ